MRDGRLGFPGLALAHAGEEMKLPSFELVARRLAHKTCREAISTDVLGNFDEVSVDESETCRRPRSESNELHDCD